jgi:hypothetical protein
MPGSTGSVVQGSLLFREVQRMDQWWLRLILLVPVGLVWWAFVKQIVLRQSVGTNPAPDVIMVVIHALFGVAMPTLFLSMYMCVEVTPGRLHVRCFPFSRRTIELGTVTSCEARTYSPISDYGGWGIRGYDDDRVYSMRGKRGVQLLLGDGKKVLIGSDRPEELVEAIRRARG